MDLMTEITIFVLAAFVGFEVISKVPTTLHTPLMCQTNAIHGIVVLGGFIVIGHSDDVLDNVIGSIAVAFGTINVVGGFMVTDRMLGMFARKPKPKAARREDRAASRRKRGRRAEESSSCEPSPCSTPARPSSALPLPRRRRPVHLRGPPGHAPDHRQARQLIAAVGMAIAVATTLALDGIGNWGLIIGGIPVGTAVGAVASIRVQMTAMPQMVALYNGVGGGAVALISWSEFREELHLLGEGAISQIPLEIFVPIMFSMVIGSVSFWGSNVAFGKLQDLIPQQPVKVPGQQVINAAAADGDHRRLRLPGVSNDDPPGRLHRSPDRGRLPGAWSCCPSAGPTCRS